LGPFDHCAIYLMQGEYFYVSLTEWLQDKRIAELINALDAELDPIHFREVKGVQRELLAYAAWPAAHRTEFDTAEGVAGIAEVARKTIEKLGAMLGWVQRTDHSLKRLTFSIAMPDADEPELSEDKRVELASRCHGAIFCLSEIVPYIRAHMDESNAFIGQVLPA
jgi:hypothetical protein